MFEYPLSTIKVNQWHNIAISLDRFGTLSYYCDGKLEKIFHNIDRNIPETTQGNLLIGARSLQEGVDNFFTGKIRSLMIWDICRSQGEIVSDSINTSSDFYHVAELSSQNPSDNPTYDLVKVNPVLNIDFSKTSATDSSGQNNPIEYINDPIFEYSIPSQLFQGNTQHPNYISPQSPVYHINPDTSFTIDGWFQTNTTGINQTIISCGNGEQEYSVYIDNNNLLNGQRGSDVLDCTLPLLINRYYHFALSYNYNVDEPTKSTLSLFVNGNLASIIFANSVPMNQNLSINLLIGAANNSDGHTTNYFNGNIQNINFWNVSHDEAQVRQWMYNQMIDDESLVSAFDFSVNPPVDTANQIPLSVTAIFDTELLYTTPSEIPFGLPMPVNATYLFHTHESIDYAPPIITSMAIQPQIFSEAHKKATFEGLQKWLGNIAKNQDFKQRFEKAYEQAKQIMDKDPRLKKVVSRIDKDGITKLIYHGRHRDQVIFSGATNAVSPCTLWWIGFVMHLTIGFFEALGLFPSVEGAAEKIYLKIVRNKTARNALASLTSEVITVSSAVEFIGVLQSQKILWSIVKILMSCLGWWALAKLMVIVIGVLTGLEAAALLAGFIIWAAQLVQLSLEYNGTCGTTPPSPKI